MAILIPECFSSRHIDKLKKLCDSDYEGEIYCYETGNCTKNKISGKKHRLTGFKIYYAGPDGADPNWGIEGLRIEVKGVCYERRFKLDQEKGIEFVFEGRFFLEQELKDYAWHEDDPNKERMLDPEQAVYCPICPIVPTDEQLAAEHQEKKYKSEGELRKILESIFKKKFPNVRPGWLINPDTGKKLEIDCYCRELSLAFEYQGEQHYSAIDFFGGESRFSEQKIRDEYKRQICKEKNITLIEIDGRKVDHNNVKEMKKYVLNELKNIGINV